MIGIKHTVDQTESFLVYNGSAMFALNEIGDIKVILEDNKLVISAYAVLAREGELVRRYYGYDHKPILSEDEYRTIASPADLPSMAWAVSDAFLAGMKCEISGKNERIDVTTRELEKKTAL